ncbi:outer membrane protein assembly factor BamE [Noviherbaspirillum suwonense]|jgi:outer membrane protein assembly factor BamE|uniref:Outer membrane protein assembly factor BamE n=2 Tax=Noviherbaspirillum suwonense TaxID=1224511 RepID=A0ABY1Q5F0_9BURK|nr:outer membrane protein assembly factor BamE [Noviherbaspirillum suwonense]
MRMLFPRSGPRPALHSGALCVLFAACLAGCASKNPLIDEPASVRRSEPAAPAKAAPAKTAQGADADGDLEVTKARPFLGFLRPYRPDIQQGNFISREMVAQLKEGMTRDQVRFVLGTPLLTDVFHNARWDYPFRMAKGNGEMTTSRVTLTFVDDKLARIEGGDLPTEADYLSRISGQPPRKSKTESPGPQPIPSSAADPQSPATTTP